MNQEAVRFGEADLSTCDREPIHIPGSIQPHGALLVFDRDRLEIEQVAGDTRLLLGIEPEGIPGMPISRLLDFETEAFVNTRLATGGAFVAPIMRLAVRTRSGPVPLDLTLHAIERTAILELEPARRTMTGAGDPIMQLKALLGRSSTPPASRSAARPPPSPCAPPPDSIARWSTASCPTAAAWSQSEDASPGLESFLGLHYPASDIPKQARELYRRNWLRAIPDIDYVAGTAASGGQPPHRRADRHEPLRSAQRVADPSRIPAQHGRLRIAVRLASSATTSSGECWCCTTTPRGTCRRTCGSRARPSRRSSRCTWRRRRRRRPRRCGSRPARRASNWSNTWAEQAISARCSPRRDLLQYLGATGWRGVRGWRAAPGWHDAHGRGDPGARAVAQ